MFFITECQSPVGEITIASDGINVVGLWINGQKYFMNTISEPTLRNDNLPVFDKAKLWLNRYFSGEKPEPYDLPLAPDGNKFRRTVWKILCEIPNGEVTTYGEVAKKVAAVLGKKSMSAQAVGGAVGHNPISIIIPCHRVIGSDGSLTGYAGGIDKKILLLKHEGVNI